MVISKTFGPFVIEMRKFTKVHGHDDTLPFTAELWVNNKSIAQCFNDGWGGECMITPNQKNIELYNKVKEIVEKTNNYLDNTEWFYTIPNLADLMAIECLEAKFIEKRQKHELVFRDLEKQLVCIPFKTNKGKISIDKLIELPNGKEFLSKTIEKYKEKGWTLLNTNI